VWPRPRPAPPPPGPPRPPTPPPGPPGPPCVVSDLTNDTARLNGFCRSHVSLHTGQLCTFECAPGDMRPDHCLWTGWDETVGQLCNGSSGLAVGGDSVHAERYDEWLRERH
jgi:hypothetical protein